MGYQDDVLAALRSIDASLKHLLALAESRPTQPAAAPTARGTTAPGSVASSQDLDSKYGDPIIKFMPRTWRGPSYKNRKMSQCPADLLDCLAESFEYFAGEAERKGELSPKGKPIADYKRLDAARARGWAKRIRAGTLSKPPASNGRGTTADIDDWTSRSEFD